MMTTNNDKTELGIYIHIPFCVCKCRYCGFLSFEDADEDIHSRYTKALTDEIRLYGSLYRDEYIVDTIFIGGGTPSVMKPEYTEQILAAVRESFDLAKTCEITIETNPGTLSREKLSAYRNCGINRLSIGVQSLNDNVLKTLGRIHSVREFEENFTLARELGFDNINIDLMFAVPDATMSIWKETLEKALALSPEHISFYSLQIEEGTPFAKMYEEGILEEIPDDTDRKMYRAAAELLSRNGYVHYEISNAAKPGFVSRHNLKYWTMKEYLGFGLGASSYFKGRRFQNTESLEEYMRTSGQSLLADSCCCFRAAGCAEDFHINTEFDNASEFVFTGLRRLSGISLEEFKRFTGRSLFEVFPEAESNIDRWQAAGLVRYERQVLKLTYDGIDISNDILSEFV